MRKTMAKIGSIALMGIFCSGMAATSALAEEEVPSADLSVSLLSKYVWRGFEFSKDSMVIQPSMTVGYKGFAANFWGNMDTDLHEDIAGDETSDWNETDFTLSYDGSAGIVGYSVGYIYYALDGLDDSQEFYVSAGLDTILAPTLTVYRDFDNYAGWYITLGISHSIPLSEDMTLDLGAQISYLDADDDAYEEMEKDAAGDWVSTGDSYSDFHDAVLSASMTFPMGKYFSITPELYYSFPLSSEADDLISAASIDGDDSDFIYGGVTLSMSF